MIDRRDFMRSSGLAVAGLALGGATRGSPDPILDIQRRTFDFFRDTTDTRTGLARDRWPTPSFASIAAMGFALTAWPIGVVNGWMTRGEARARTLACLEFLAAARQGPEATGVSGYKGFFYHFLDMQTGLRFARTELSTIDTTLLLGGVLFAQTWFGDDDAQERRIRALAEDLYRAVDWTWIVPRGTFVGMGWHPETGFIASDWDTYNEAMLLYVLALASPTHAVPPSAWTALTQRFDASWTDRYGQAYLHFPPLFGHQYSHMFVDFRGIRDPYIAGRGIDYFENTRRATYAQRGYAIANAGGFAGYGADCWGLTACDGPGDFTMAVGGRTREFFSYSARGPGDRDDGTIAPTAALGSIAFAPEIVVPAARAMQARYGRGIYARYGFRDSFNPTLTDPAAPLRHGAIVPGVGWVDGDHLGIDQGPILGGIENWRTGLIWNTMRRNPHIRRGLVLAGFAGGWLA
ncbi:glucoamylase family protein [Sphingomonas sp.]|uniref:glucoamylase family protein n=1 Tax=Sphingomonas sp. TaxID=28214 RepID=UPI0035BC3718